MKKHKEEKKKVSQIRFRDIDGRLFLLKIYEEKLCIFLEDVFYNYIWNITYNKKTGYFNDHRGHELFV